MEGEFTLKKAEKWRDGENAVDRIQMTGTRVNMVPSEARNQIPVIPTHEHVWIRSGRREN